MRTTDLGTEFTARTPSRDDLVFRSDVQALVTNAMVDVEKRLQQFIRAQNQPPTVNVAASPAQVSVAAPAVKVEPYIEASIPGMSELASEIASLRADLRLVITQLSKPVIRTVERDTDGLITRVTENRS